MLPAAAEADRGGQRIRAANRLTPQGDPYGALFMSNISQTGTAQGFRQWSEFHEESKGRGMPVA